MTIQKTPTIHKAPFIYKQGNGGAPGDFGNGGGVVPTGYRQVAGVYIRNGVSNSAYKQYKLNNIFGINKTDFTGIRIEGKFFAPSTPVWNQNVALFNLRHNGSPAHSIYIVVLFIQGDANIQGANGSGVNGQVHSNKNITGVFKASIFETSTIVDDFIYTNIYNPPVNQSDPIIFPFPGDRASYTTYSNNVATLGTKLYDADGNLMLYFVPVVRESDEMPGLYEIVHDVFCDNAYCNVIEKIEE